LFDLQILSSAMMFTDWQRRVRTRFVPNINARISVSWFAGNTSSDSGRVQT